MKNYIVSVKIKLNDCEVGIAKVFVRDGKEEFASDAALNFFDDKYECEIVSVEEFDHPLTKTI